jgi:predicted  nucleic acid-binding Zn-ribbon protein
VKLEATAKDIRALLQLAELDRRLDQGGSREQRLARDGVAGSVPRTLLARYELLLEVGRIPIVVAIERGACVACHVRLPTAVAYKARRSAAVHTCPQCRRMLYAPELLREESEVADAKARPAPPVPAPGRS